MRLTPRGQNVVAIGFGMLATAAMLLAGWIEGL